MYSQPWMVQNSRKRLKYGPKGHLRDVTGVRLFQLNVEFIETCGVRAENAY
jgi:hypothetical protein